jgi:hypothetical protein
MSVKTNGQNRNSGRWRSLKSATTKVKGRVNKKLHKFKLNAINANFRLNV